MKIIRKTYRDGNLYPSAYNWLKSIPEECLFYQKYGERHPFSRYSNSLQKIMKAYGQVLDGVEAATSVMFDSQDRLPYEDEDIIESQSSLLYALQSHFDDCYEILRSIHPPVPNKQERYVERWLEEVKHPSYKYFKQNTDPYKEYFNQVVNEMKHGGGRLCSLVIFARGNGIIAQSRKSAIRYSSKNIRMFGYHVEGVHSDGALGPHPDIHPDNTAISFNYDLRYHFANIYRVSEFLTKAVCKGIKCLHGKDIPYPGKVEKAPRKEDWEKIADRVGSLPKLFYRNEFNRKAPEISLFKPGNESEVLIDTPGLSGYTWHGDVAIQAKFQVDSVSLSYRPPYGI